MNSVIQIAEKEIGTKENPPNSNIVKYSTWFGLPRLAWCAMFVSWCYAKAGKPLGNLGFTKGFAGCQTGYALFVKKGWITDLPVEGDIVLFDWNGDKRYDHTGLFVKWIDKNYFEAIEGNTAIGNDSNGGEVMRRKRHKKYAVFAHPKV